MDATHVLLTLILLTLVGIAFLLRAILRVLSVSLRAGRLSDTERDKQLPVAGQTINVNLATMGPSGQTNPITVTRTADSPDADAAARLARDEAEREKAEREKADAARAQSAARGSSAPFAVKCPKCQAENSSYRSECFNCGSAM